MTFEPYQYPISTPRATQMQPAVQAPAAPQRSYSSFVVPYGAESLIGDILDPTAVVQRDLFLLHPSECSFQRLLVGVDADTTPTFLSVQLIQKNGQQEAVLAAERVFKSLRTQPEVIEDATPWGEGPVFLRLRSTYSGARLLVTVETLTSEVF